MGQILSSSKTPKKEEAPLLQPAMEGNLPLLQQLLGHHIASYDYDASSSPSQLSTYINAANTEGNTALIGACFGGHLTTVQFLLDKEADLSRANSIGCSPLWIAAGYGHDVIVKFLLSVLLESKHQYYSSSSSSSSVEEVWEIVTQVNSSGDTPLIAAASRGHASTCQLLLDAMISKCDTEQEGFHYAYRMLCLQNNSGDTALAIAVGNGAEGPLLDLLLDREDQYCKELYTQNDHETNKEEEEEEEDTIGVVPSTPAAALPTRPLHTTSSKGLTPLLVACERCHITIVQELLRRGAQLTSDANGRSPLSVAAFCGLLEVVEFLLHHDDDHGEEQEEKEEGGGSSRIGKELLDAVDNKGCTAVWLAARTGNGKMVKVLLEAGADPTIENEEGLTPEAVGKQFQKDSVVKAFEDFRRIEILEE